MSMMAFVVFVSLPAFAMALKAQCDSTDFRAHTAAYCGNFTVNSVPVKIKLIFSCQTEADIYSSVYGFDMYCTHSQFAMCGTQKELGFPIDLDPNNEGQDNCLRKQFEGVDEHMSALQVFYDEPQDRIRLVSDAMAHVFITRDVDPYGQRCDGDMYKFTVTDTTGSTITTRRLTLKDVLADASATQPLHV
jgi:hypothetical protein